MDYKFQPIVITFYTISLSKISNIILSGNNCFETNNAVKVCINLKGFFLIKIKTAGKISPPGCLVFHVSFNFQLLTVYFQLFNFQLLTFYF